MDLRLRLFRFVRFLVLLLPDFGNKLVEARWWKRVGRNKLMEASWWERVVGNALVETHGWKQVGLEQSYLGKKFFHTISRAPFPPE